MSAISDRHLAALRDLLRRDVLTGADWYAALTDAARLAGEALVASEALIAVWDPAAGLWSAVTASGERLADEEIALVASRSVLEQARASGEPLLSTAQLPALRRSASMRRHDVRHVLAVPVRFWQYGPEQPTATFGACLYADRRGDDPPFSADDVELLRDFAHLAERTLSLLCHLRHVERALDHAREEVSEVRNAAAASYRQAHYEGRDPGFVRDVLTPLERAAQADKVGVLLLGPTGAGKSHLAQAFHYASSRRAGPFVILDCGQVTSSEALGAELFGFAKKSGFSTPAEGRLGKARLADGGTLFIDEVGALPLELQQRLLRLIQTGRFSPLGSAQEQSVDVQVVAAANQDLAALVRAGRFREDLYWRLAELVIAVPPLEARRADIAGLARTFLGVAASRFRRPEIKGFTPPALATLEAYPWSTAGNLRGLEHTVNRSVLLAPVGCERLDDAQLSFPQSLSAAIPPSPPPRAPAALGEEASAAAHELLRRKLEEHHGRLATLAADADVATALGLRAPPIPMSTLRLRLRRLGLAPEMAAAREPVSLEVIVAALRRHGDGHAAAQSLGLTRDQLAWRLRQAGLGIREVLRGARPENA